MASPAIVYASSFSNRSGLSRSSRGEARVGDAERAASALFDGEIRQFVQRVRRAACAARGRACQHHALDARGMAQRELLRDHAAERHAHDEASIPAERIEQRRRIVSVVLHRVRAVGHRRLSEAALVVRQQLEVLRERPVEDGWLRAEVAAGAADVEEARAAAGAFVVGADAGGGDVWHWWTVRRLCVRAGAWRSTSAVYYRQ